MVPLMEARPHMVIQDTQHRATQAVQVLGEVGEEQQRHMVPRRMDEVETGDWTKAVTRARRLGRHKMSICTSLARRH